MEQQLWKVVGAIDLFLHCRVPFVARSSSHHHQDCSRQQRCGDASEVASKSRSLDGVDAVVLGAADEVGVGVVAASEVGLGTGEPDLLLLEEWALCGLSQCVLVTGEVHLQSWHCEAFAAVAAVVDGGEEDAVAEHEHWVFQGDAGLWVT